VSFDPAGAVEAYRQPTYASRLIADLNIASPFPKDIAGEVEVEIPRSDRLRRFDPFPFELSSVQDVTRQIGGIRIMSMIP